MLSGARKNGSFGVSMNKIKILLFATLRDYVGARTLDMDIPVGMTIAGLKAQMVKIYPKLAPVQESMMAAINREYAADEQELPPDAEIAFFPPVSGG
jgi:molybdopterin converting factor subunit 1